MHESLCVISFLVEVRLAPAFISPLTLPDKDWFGPFVLGSPLLEAAGSILVCMWKPPRGSRVSMSRGPSCDPTPDAAFGVGAANVELARIAIAKEEPSVIRIMNL